LHRLPVVKEEDHTVLIGMLDRREVIQYYNQRVQEMKSTHRRVEIESDREATQLKNIPVGRAVRRDVQTIRSDMPLGQAREFVYHSKFNSFPVVDASGQLVGILSLSDCQKAFDENAEKTLTAQDIASRDVVTVTEDDTVFSALTKIVQGDYSILPVVNKQKPGHVVGVISRRDIMSIYDDIVIRKVLTDKSTA
ncbi:MAG TPA: CBS domain-containing protein, partial [Desulfobacterales bacterium]|nr:CBS domain-containing protein [Desulfobacterales bacterium]